MSAQELIEEVTQEKPYGDGKRQHQAEGAQGGYFVDISLKPHSRKANSYPASVRNPKRFQRLPVSVGLEHHMEP